VEENGDAPRLEDFFDASSSQTRARKRFQHSMRRRRSLQREDPGPRLHPCVFSVFERADLFNMSAVSDLKVLITRDQIAQK